MKNKTFLKWQNRNGLTAIVVSLVLCSCHNGVPTPIDTKYISDFHTANFCSSVPVLDSGLALYVDYSTCNKLGQNSRFFQSLEPAFKSLTTSYFSIKGSKIVEEDLNTEGVYSRLRNIQEVNYADLQSAADQIAEGSQEAVLLTDGEYFTRDIARGNDNNSWLASALKTWILKGYDIHILAEPYDEVNKGKVYHKKRFYIIFTDDRKENNVYARIVKTAHLDSFPDVDEFHLSVSRAQMKGNGNNSAVYNSTLQCKVKGYGSYEVADWYGCDWGTIEKYIINAYDSATGEPLENGENIISLGIDRNSFGGYRIMDIDLKVYDINQEYADYYFVKESGAPVGHLDYQLTEIPNFMLIDKQEFTAHSNINIYFNRLWFDPANLTGDPYNYFKLDILIDSVEPIFDSHREKFEFESISNPGNMNVSVATSIEQCLADDEVQKKMKGQVAYTIYIKSERK